MAARGMKQTELARKLGTSQSVVSHWLCGDREPQLRSALLIERELGVPAMALLEEPAPGVAGDPASKATREFAQNSEEPCRNHEAAGEKTGACAEVTARVAYGTMTGTMTEPWDASGDPVELRLDGVPVTVPELLVQMGSGEKIALVCVVCKTTDSKRWELIEMEDGKGAALCDTCDAALEEEEKSK